MAAKKKVKSLWTDRDPGPIEEAQYKLSREIYRRSGCPGADKYDTMRCAEHCASRIIAGIIIAKEPLYGS